MNRFTRIRAQWIAAAEDGDPAAKDKLVELLTGTNQSPYWRAVAANFMGQWANDPLVKSSLLAQLRNEHPLIREKTAHALEPALADTNVFAALTPLLNDSVRNVRVVTAWTLRATLDLQSQAGKDLQEALDLEADQPTGQFKEALLLLARQQPVEALVHLKKATAWDPISPPFLCLQAEVLDQLGQSEEALKTLDRAQLAAPNDPHIPFVRTTILNRNGHGEQPDGQ